MAIYQFIIVLLPGRWASENNDDVNKLYSEEGYDISEAWKQFPPSQKLDPLLSKILPRGKSWDLELELWGKEENNDIQIWRQDGEVEDITIRLDLRDNISSLIPKIIDLALEINCVFFIPEALKIINPDLFALRREINISNAAQYVKDPRKYLNNLSKNIDNQPN